MQEPKVIFLQTTFQTTRGARTANSQLAWYQWVRVLTCRSRPVRNAFKWTRGTVDPAPRRRVGKIARLVRSWPNWNICFWHWADIDADAEHVRFWG